MTAHDPRVTLTEAELTYGRTYPNIGDRGRWYSEGSVREIIAARLAPIRALVDPDAPAKNCDGHKVGNAGCYVSDLAASLRAALDAPVSASQDHDGDEGQGEGCETCRAEVWCPICEDEREAEHFRVVHNHRPGYPMCNERRVDGQLRGACLNDDGSPR